MAARIARLRPVRAAVSPAQDSFAATVVPPEGVVAAQNDSSGLAPRVLSAALSAAGLSSWAEWRVEGRGGGRTDMAARIARLRPVRAAVSPAQDSFAATAVPPEGGVAAQNDKGAERAAGRGRGNDSTVSRGVE